MKKVFNWCSLFRIFYSFHIYKLVVVLVVVLEEVDVLVLVLVLVVVVLVLVVVVEVEVLVVVLNSAKAQVVPLYTTHWLVSFLKKKSPATGSTGKVVWTLLLDCKLPNLVIFIPLLLY